MCYPTYTKFYSSGSRTKVMSSQQKKTTSGSFTWNFLNSATRKRQRVCHCLQSIFPKRIYVPCCSLCCNLTCTSGMWSALYCFFSFLYIYLWYKSCYCLFVNKRMLWISVGFFWLHWIKVSLINDQSVVWGVKTNIYKV